MRDALHRAGIEIEPVMAECVLPSFEDWVARLP
jgi:hypothetical protein